MSLVYLLLVSVILCGALCEGSPLDCTVDADCLNVNGSSCVGGNCTCPESTPILVTVANQNGSYCLAAFNETGSNCTFTPQCTYEHSQCSKEGRCGCDTKFYEKDGVCAPQTKNAVIPIAVGVAIGVAVLGTLCLYLWMSRKKDGA